MTKQYICHNCAKEFDLQENQNETAKFCSQFCCGFHWEKRQGVGKVSGKEIFAKGTIIEKNRVVFDAQGCLK